MTSGEYVVGIVVDPVFGDRLHALAEGMPVWVVDTPVNRAAAEVHWQAHAGHSHAESITTFRVDPVQAPEEWCAGILDTVLVHHAAYSHTPPVSTLQVVGARPVPNLVRVLADLGFGSTTTTKDGFRARAA